MKVLNYFSDLLNRDSSDEGTSNSLIVLVRYITLIIMLYHFAAGVYVLLRGLTFYGIVLLLSAVIMLTVMALSYKARPHIMLAVMGADIVAATAILTYGFGWRCSFQNMIYVLMMILWYDADTDRRLKMVFSLLLAGWVCAISALTPFGDSILDPDTTEYEAVVFINIVIFSVCLSFVAYFFCTKYIEAEHKLFLYNKKLKSMAESDPLTRLPNRRCIMSALDEITENYEANGNSVSIAIGDIDFFKKVNDTYGHDCGDYALKELADMFSEFMEGRGFAGRWGGEEFLFVFSAMNGDDAYVALDSLREKIEARVFGFADVQFKLTMTFGLEEYCKMTGSDDTIKSADNKLYLGKESGRNKVVF